jgi:hypothetical protein
MSTNTARPYSRSWYAARADIAHLPAADVAEGADENWLVSRSMAAARSAAVRVAVGVMGTSRSRPGDRRVSVTRRARPRR